MKRILILCALIVFLGISSFAQKMGGFGGEISVFSIKPNIRLWVSKATGFEIFGGIASEMGEFKPNDLEAGFKFLHSIQYNRTDRTYFAIMGKWKWVNEI